MAVFVRPLLCIVLFLSVPSDVLKGCKLIEHKIFSHQEKCGTGWPAVNLSGVGLPCSVKQSCIVHRGFRASECTYALYMEGAWKPPGRLQAPQRAAMDQGFVNSGGTEGFIQKRGLNDVCRTQ